MLFCGLVGVSAAGSKRAPAHVPVRSWAEAR